MGQCNILIEAGHFFPTGKAIILTSQIQRTAQSIQLDIQNNFRIWASDRMEAFQILCSEFETDCSQFCLSVFLSHTHKHAWHFTTVFIHSAPGTEDRNIIKIFSQGVRGLVRSTGI